MSNSSVRKNKVLLIVDGGTQLGHIPQKACKPVSFVQASSVIYNFFTYDVFLQVIIWAIINQHHFLQTIIFSKISRSLFRLVFSSGVFELSDRRPIFYPPSFLCTRQTCAKTRLGFFLPKKPVSGVRSTEMQNDFMLIFCNILQRFDSWSNDKWPKC